MQDQKNNLSTSNSKNQLKGFLLIVLVFFIPVVLAFGITEYLVQQIPFNYVLTSKYFNSHKESIEVLVLGPSQTNSAINPKYFDKETISLASTAQHHDLDYQILTQLKERMPNLKYVVLELSYSHLELPHNNDSFWKHSVYLKYYGVNAFGRNTYFKDEFIWLSNPDIYSRKLVDHYLKQTKVPNFNEYGFNESNFEGFFKTLNYNETAIESINNFRINVKPDLAIFRKNTDFLYKMLDYTKSQDLNVVICTIPMHKTYLEARNPEILHRRDSILLETGNRYNNVRIFEREHDTIHFETPDFINQNHLNSKGAEKFSKDLNAFINSQF